MLLHPPPGAPGAPGEPPVRGAPPPGPPRPAGATSAARPPGRPRGAQPARPLPSTPDRALSALMRPGVGGLRQLGFEHALRGLPELAGAVAGPAAAQVQADPLGTLTQGPL